MEYHDRLRPKWNQSDFFQILESRLGKVSFIPPRTTYFNHIMTYSWIWCYFFLTDCLFLTHFLMFSSFCVLLFWISTFGVWRIAVSRLAIYKKKWINKNKTYVYELRILLPKRGHALWRQMIKLFSNKPITSATDCITISFGFLWKENHFHRTLLSFHHKTN